MFTVASCWIGAARCGALLHVLVHHAYLTGSGRVVVTEAARGRTRDPPVACVKREGQRGGEGEGEGFGCVWGTLVKGESGKGTHVRTSGIREIGRFGGRRGQVP